MLAAEYVLGTLAGSARKRFECLLLNDIDLRNLVSMWSDKINVLGAHLPKQTPSTDLLPSIKKRLGLSAKQEQTRKKPQLWRAWALAASFACFVLAFVLFTQILPDTQAPVNNIVSLINDKAQAQTVLVKSNLKAKTLLIKVLKPKTISANNDWELWVVTKNSPVPKSLGVIPSNGTKNIVLTAENIRWLENAKAFAISLERKGGSTTGQPSSVIPYQGTVHQL